MFVVWGCIWRSWKPRVCHSAQSLQQCQSSLRHHFHTLANNDSLEHSEQILFLLHPIVDAKPQLQVVFWFTYGFDFESMDVFEVWTPLTQAYRMGFVEVRSEKHGGLLFKRVRHDEAKGLRFWRKGGHRQRMVHHRKGQILVRDCHENNTIQA